MNFKKPTELLFLASQIIAIVPRAKMNTDQKNNNVIIIKKEPAFLPATKLEPLALRLKVIEVIGHWNNIFVKKDVHCMQKMQFHNL